MIKNLFKKIRTKIYFNFSLKDDYKLNKENVRINKLLTTSTNFEQLYSLHEEFSPKFNLINHSSFLKKLNFLNNKGINNITESQRDKILKKLKKDLEVLNDEITPRKVSNIYYFLVKNQNIFEEGHKADFTTIIQILRKNSIHLINEMNDQELANLIYCSKQLKDMELLKENHELIIKKSQKMSLRSFSVILHCYADNNNFDQQTQELFGLTLQSNINRLKELKELDFSTILFFVCKANLTQKTKEQLLSILVPMIPRHVNKMNSKGFSSLCFSLSNVDKRYFNDGIFEFVENVFKEKIQFFKKNKLVNLNIFLLMASGNKVHGSEEFYETVYSNIFEENSFNLILKDYETLLYYFQSEKLGIKSKVYLRIMEEKILKDFDKIMVNVNFDSITRLFIGCYRVKEVHEFGEVFFQKILKKTIEIFKNKESDFNLESVVNTISVLEAIKRGSENLERVEKYIKETMKILTRILIEKHYKIDSSYQNIVKVTGCVKTLKENFNLEDQENFILIKNLDNWVVEFLYNLVENVEMSKMSQREIRMLNLLINSINYEEIFLRNNLEGKNKLKAIFEKIDDTVIEKERDGDTLKNSIEKLRSRWFK